MVRRLLSVVVLLALVAGCGAVVPGPSPTSTVRPTVRPLGPGEVAVPLERWEPVNGVPVACAGVGWAGEYRLHGSPADPRVVWITFPDGTRHEIAWPPGYSARFTPALELLDEAGSVVAREGSLIVGGCDTPQPGVLWVTPENLDVEPAVD